MGKLNGSQPNPASAALNQYSLSCLKLAPCEQAVGGRAERNRQRRCRADIQCIGHLSLFGHRKVEVRDFY